MFEEIEIKEDKKYHKEIKQFYLQKFFKNFIQKNENFFCNRKYQENINGSSEKMSRKILSLKQKFADDIILSLCIIEGYKPLPEEIENFKKNALNDMKLSIENNGEDIDFKISKKEILQKLKQKEKDTKKLEKNKERETKSFAKRIEERKKIGSREFFIEKH